MTINARRDAAREEALRLATTTCGNDDPASVVSRAATYTNFLLGTDHIQAELGRLSERLAAYPDPNEHAGLYAAQQALSWALEPSGFASPFDMVTRAPTKRKLHPPISGAVIGDCGAAG